MKSFNNYPALPAPSKIWIAFLATVFTLFNGMVSFAQSVPENVEVDIDAGGDSVWYGQPWVWAVGVAVFIVIIVAITRSNNKNA